MAYEKLSVPHYTYVAKVLRVVDGDTLDIMCDLGFRTFKKVRVRLYGIDTPETYGVKKDSEEYARGKVATEFVEEWLGLKPDAITGFKSGSGEVIIRSHDGKPLGQGKYGRWLCDVIKPGVALTLNEALIKNKLAEAVEY